MNFYSHFYFGNTIAGDYKLLMTITVTIFSMVSMVSVGLVGSEIQFSILRKNELYFLFYDQRKDVRSNLNGETNSTPNASVKVFFKRMTFELTEIFGTDSINRFKISYSPKDCSKKETLQIQTLSRRKRTLSL